MLHWLSGHLVADGETISRLPTHGTDETFMPRSGQCISLNLMLESLCHESRESFRSRSANR